MSKTRDFRKAFEVLIRTVSASEAQAVRSIAEQAGIEAWTTKQYAEEASRNGTVFYLAELRREILGFISGRVVPGSHSGVDGEIYNVAVKPDSRRRGTGKHLLKTAVDRFRSAGCTAIWLEVRASNENAIQFYENNGFAAVGRRIGFYSNPAEDALIMKLELTDNSP